MTAEQGKGGGKTEVKTEAEKTEKLSPKGVTIRVGAETFMLRPKRRSIFPKRRRLVKTVILDSILQFLGFSSSSESEAQEAKVDDRCFNMSSSTKEIANNKQIYPNPPGHGNGLN